MPVDVLYVGGTGRSGSTVVANALGGVPGMVSVGELRFLWERGVLENRLCGCGQPFADCPFWRQVMETAYGSVRPDARATHRLLTDLTRLRRLPDLLRPGARDALGRSDSGQKIASILTPLYSAIAEVSGASVIVDSSKLPTYAMVLDVIPELDVRVAHLVRDPRAAAFSWQRKKEQPDRRTPGYMEQRGSVKSSVLWAVWNAALERAWKDRPQSYLRRAYEDVVATPMTELTALAGLVGIDGVAERFTDPQTVLLEPSHTVAGNPARLSSGPTRLRIDDEWVRAMPASDQRTVVLLAGLLMKRYGYDTRIRPPGDPAPA